VISYNLQGKNLHIWQSFWLWYKCILPIIVHHQLLVRLNLHFVADLPGQQRFSFGIQCSKLILDLLNLIEHRTIDMTILNFTTNRYIESLNISDFTRTCSFSPYIYIYIYSRNISWKIKYFNTRFVFIEYTIIIT